MSRAVIVVDRPSDFRWDTAGHTIVTTRDYIARPDLVRGAQPKVINLSRSYAYLGAGYYCSLLAEARSHRVIPTVETVLDLNQKSLYGYAIPDLEDDLNRRARRLAQYPDKPFTLHIFFGYADDNHYQSFARRVFDWFRCPMLEVKVRLDERLRIASIRAMSLADLEDEPSLEALFTEALPRYTRQSWRQPRSRPPARYTLAVLHNPKEQLPPSSPRSLQRLAKVAESLDVEVELIEKKDFLRLAEFDALFIRETTSLDNHTYRFAKRAELEGIPVLDDPTSILRCTNKVYLAELLQANRIATPRTVVVDSVKQVERLEEEFGYPVVLKIPDGSFSRGVYKASDRRELKDIAEALLEDSDLILAQEYMYTDLDWRVGVLDGEPLYVCQYLMAKAHWQIMKHGKEGKVTEGKLNALRLEEAPHGVVDAAVRAARLIGDGLYGVDIKQNERGIFVIEVNDNPNLDTGNEDLVEKDRLWQRLIQWYLKRLNSD